MNSKWFALASVFMASSASAEQVTAVAALDVDRYLGTWNEVASLPQIFQIGCACTQAEYKLQDDGIIGVTNSCVLGNTGVPLRIQGSARVPNDERPAELKVKFFNAFEADYWVLALADDYSHALVGTPNRRSLWILARERTLPEETYKGLVETARSQGFDVSKLRMTRQTGCAN